VAAVIPEPGFPGADDGRLRLVPLGAAALVAVDAGDADVADRLCDAAWPRPLLPPPLVGEHLAFLADRLATEGPASGWWNWAIVVDEPARVAGVIGLGGPPGDDAAVEIGYSLYAAARGRGFATAALVLVVPIALARPGVRVARVTAGPGNGASIRVAERAGMAPAGVRRHPGGGSVVVLETRRASAAGVLRRS